MVKFDIITIFPEIFEGFLKESILGRAQKPIRRAPSTKLGTSQGKKKLISIKVHQLRKWAKGKHQMVDDRPFGGGPGMVLKLEPIFRAVSSLKLKSKKEKVKTIVINFSPRGKRFTTLMAKKFAKYDHIIFICGRYEGIDERVSQKIADVTISVGDFITIGGEVPAMAVIEATSRFVPGVIGKEESVQKHDYPQYTRPEVFSPAPTSPKASPDAKALGDKSKGKQNWKVPKVLLSGDHKKIKEWREEHSNKNSRLY